MTDPATDRILDAALSHVPFDGWSEATLNAAALDAGVGTDLAQALFPRAGLDLALAYHRRGDARMRIALSERDLTPLRFRDRVALAVRLRLEDADREAVRRAAALMALPQNAPEAARALCATEREVGRCDPASAAKLEPLVRRIGEVEYRRGLLLAEAGVPAGELFDATHALTAGAGR